ncbi:DNA polymerase III, alpha subunit [Magnetococcus marinus MC-1]|uniref:DNA polymerase III subunit alpha n=1 Tax=Magnetococcus marinus (strain ATCC BAA-1437 / JCM 17883 / MC-1) TaxID=156889 RepID=A0LCM6_MAGMM|nr:DNA polymerase III subunit alpha [Magnetococcus marinus]ABK45719.1 DNA polymerase III, alpha subunit [Magnetococcus marinus MC-1]
MPASFVHLHLHTGYSLLTSTVRLKQAIERAQSLQMPALALTDQGNLFGAIQFYSGCLKAGIKPLLGAQLYLVPDHTNKEERVDKEVRDQVILLCRNEEGWKNLMRLIAKGHLDGSHGLPRIDLPLLKQHSAGLLALSAGAKGAVGRLLAQERPAEAEAAAAELAAIFGDDGQMPNFHLELQRHGEPGEERLIQQTVVLAQKLNLPIVASCDIHYMDPEDANARDALYCVGAVRTLYEENRPRLSDRYAFATPAEMAERFADLPEALENTRRIAMRCNLQLKLGTPMLPDFALPPGQTLEGEMRTQSEAGLEERLSKYVLPRFPAAEHAELRQRYHDRLTYELGIINQMGFPGYFLIVSDFIKWGKDHHIPVGPGRGSGAGSLVAWSLSITDLDPIRYTLLFERFLNPERVSMPDFDVDFCMDRREEVIGYVQQKYGEDRVAQIITFGTMQAKAVIRDVGRVLEFPYGRVDKIAKLVPNVLGITLKEALEQEPRLRDMMEDEEEVGHLINLALALEGSPRSCGTHAAGVVISNGPLTDTVPLYRDPRSSMPVTQFNMGDVEKAGLVKFDFLGLKTLTVIDNTLKIVNARRAQEGERAEDRVPIDIAAIDIEDERAFRLLMDGRTKGVFQLESSGMREILKKLAPDTFEDIIALVALYRPGPLGSGMVDDFIARKHGRAVVEYPLPQLEPILRETYGVILYQEQVMKIAQVLAGYSLGAADLLRRAMGKKKPEEMAKQRSIFMDGAKAQQIDPEKAGYIFDLMEKFAGYGFNKSHSAAYALISYQTAWLKAHYPVAFMAATLSADINNTDKVVNFVRECHDMSVQVLPPDVNRSAVIFSVQPGAGDEDAVRFGLAAIKNVGEAPMAALVKAREEGGPFASLLDLCQRTEGGNLNRRTLENLIKAGACDGLGKGNRAALLSALPEALNRGTQHQKDQKLGFMNLFGDEEAENSESTANWKLPEVPDWPEEERLEREKEALGFYISSHPLRKYEAEMHDYGLMSLSELREKYGPTSQEPMGNDGRVSVRFTGVVVERKLHRTKKGDRMLFVTLEDMLGQMEGVVFPDAYVANREVLEEEGPLIFEGQAEVRDEEVKVAIHSAVTLNNYRRHACRFLRVEVPAGLLRGGGLDELMALLQPHIGVDGCRTILVVRMAKARVTLELTLPGLVVPSDGVLDTLIQRFGNGAASFRKTLNLPAA